VAILGGNMCKLLKIRRSLAPLSRRSTATKSIFTFG